MSSPAAPENSEQIEFWNGRGGLRWAAGQARLDRSLEPFGRAVITRAAPRAGERVVDVGCGCGALSLPLGEVVGPSGSVLGLDISGPMLALAGERATGRVNVSFQQADASTIRLDAPVDLLVSRFGVMFFGDPVRAFTNLFGLLKPGGRVVFACWRSMAENPWLTVPAKAAMPLFPPAEPTPPDAPGPFAFAQSSRVADILAKAGFADTAIEPFDAPLVFADASEGLDEAVSFAVTLGPTARLLDGADDALRERVAAVVREALIPHVTPTGVALGGSVWIVSARRP